MSSHANNVKSAVADLEAAVTAGDFAEAQKALGKVLTESAAVTAAKTAPHAKAASAASTAADASVVAACDSCIAACATAAAAPPPVAAAGVVGGLFDGSLWTKFLSNLPAILTILRDIFSGA